MTTNTIKQIKFKWTGIRPLLMHNGLLADAEYPYTKALKSLRADKNKKANTLPEQRRLEWDGSLYWDDNDGPIIPSDNIERTLQQGAQALKKGKEVQAAVFCSEAWIRLDYKGPRTKDELYEANFSLRKLVVIDRKRVMSIRPMFPTGWSITFDLEYDSTTIDADKIVESAAIAGQLKGLGDWRPKFGRFISEVVK